MFEIVQKYYLHYDKKSGAIRSVSNEPPQLDWDSIELSFEEYRSYVEGEKNPEDYIIGYAKGVDGKTEITVMPVSNQVYGFRNNVFEWINQVPDADTELIVGWNGKDNTWAFNLSDKAKERVKNGIINNTVFFVTLETDFDFLIRSIIINVKDLLEQDKIVIPFTSKLETQIDKISISSKIFFQSYGLKINE
jgi:hypothetical protein